MGNDTFYAAAAAATYDHHFICISVLLPGIAAFISNKQNYIITIYCENSFLCRPINNLQLWNVTMTKEKGISTVVLLSA